MMKKAGQIALGLLLGVLLSALLLPMLGTSAGGPPPTLAAPDNAGSLERIVLHYTTNAADLLLPTYAPLIAALAPGTRVIVVVEDTSAFDDLRSRLQALSVDSSTLEPVETGYPITPWSRDRYTLTYRDDAQNPSWLLVVPEATDGTVTERQNDWMVPWTLAEHYEDVHVVSLPIRFDGGDLLVTETHVFASYRLVEKNLGTRVASIAELESLLEGAFGREVFLFGGRPEDVPIHHLGMYLTPLPDGRILAADPGLAAANLTAAELTALGADLSPSNLARFEYVRDALSRGGFEVIPLPVIPLNGGLNYVTYNNLVMEVRSGRTHVFVPTYADAGLAALDRVVLAQLRSLGLEVTSLDVSRIFRFNGSVRCLVNVLSRAGLG